MNIADTHRVYVFHHPYMGGFQTKCSCGGFESDPQPTRPQAIREHTVHAAQFMAVFL